MALDIAHFVCYYISIERNKIKILLRSQRGLCKVRNQNYVLILMMR